MSEHTPSEITRILQDWNDGDAGAKERLVPFVYEELKRQARLLMSRERANHTLQPTALVHEAFVRLSEQTGIEWHGRSHFYGIASRLMRQVLVDHARLHAAGATADAVPYLVMECVRGEPIDKFCRSRRLSLDERLRLFGKVCEAVSYAHRNLVVHRDLKPSNILVNEDGEPKLLDFGISKLLGKDGADGAGGVTQLGALTPLYASPEQVRGEAVTTASDVYSLGVILFKVLTEEFPYRAVEKTNGELLRETTESAPRLPSAAAQAPFTTSRLKGDLDNIILKSLSKEPERRYLTVEQFVRR